MFAREVLGLRLVSAVLGPLSFTYAGLLFPPSPKI
jgi:hypothetical protein